MNAPANHAAGLFPGFRGPSVTASRSAHCGFRSYLGWTPPVTITNRNRDLSPSYLAAWDTFGSGGPNTRSRTSARPLVRVLSDFFDIYSLGVHTRVKNRRCQHERPCARGSARKRRPGRQKEQPTDRNPRRFAETGAAEPKTSVLEVAMFRRLFTGWKNPAPHPARAQADAALARNPGKI